MHYPEEYTRGFVEFFYRKFFVSPAVLIPRFETEDLVRAAIKLARGAHFDTLIDVGTGSGIIPISILSEVETNDYLSLQTYALDISPEALAVAKKNAESNGVKIEFRESDLLSAFLKEPTPPSPSKERGWGWGEQNRLDVGTWSLKLFSVSNILITANLPYIRDDDQINMSPDTAHEPSLALYGGPWNGFEIYERFFAQIPDFINRYTPENLVIMVEMGFDQQPIAEALFQKYEWDYEFFADSFNIFRFATIRPCKKIQPHP